MADVTDSDGFAPDRESHHFDEAVLAAYLRAQVPGLDGPWSVRQFRGGQSNPTFQLKSPAGEYVLRKQPPGKLLPGAHAVDRECRVLSALRDSAVPVPRILHYCADVSVVGTPFYLMEFLRGRVFRDPLLPGMTPEDRGAIYDAMNGALASLHTVNWKVVGLEGFGRPENYFARQISLWTRQYKSTKTGDVPAMERLMEWLPRNLPPDDCVSIVHGDFRLENLMFDPDEPRVVAVLDWELSTLGHPLSDLSFNCITYHLPSDNPVARGFMGVNFEELGIPPENGYVSRYCERTGRDGIRDWTYYMAFSLFRTAAIQQGVYARALKGNASSETAHWFGASYPIVAERGWALVENS